MTVLITLALIAAVVTGGLGLAALIWSLWRPGQALWPPQGGQRHDAITLGLTYGYCGAVVVLALTGWRGMDWQAVVRWGLRGGSLVAGYVVSAVTMRQFGVAAFAIAPLTDEPWLRTTYGHAFDTYAARVRRFI